MFNRIVNKVLLIAVISIFMLPTFAEEVIIPAKGDLKQPKQTEEMQNLNQYFEYLPNAVHNNWTPYKANSDYEVTVQFRVKKNGEITAPVIVKSTNEKANASVLNAVKSGAPYKPLPAKFPGDSVNTQVELRYIKN